MTNESNTSKDGLVLRTHALHKVRVAEGTNNLGEVNNRTVTWAQLSSRLKAVFLTREKYAEYSAMSVERKAVLKNSAGYWIGANCEDGRRKRAQIYERDVVCFDIDNGDLYDGDLMADLANNATPVSNFEYLAHTTRSHIPLKPRIRMVFLLSKPLPADKYNVVVRILAERMDRKMVVVDPVSFRVAQMMFFPSCSGDMQDHFRFFHNPGEPVDVEKLLKEWGKNWLDLSQLPRCPNEDAVRDIALRAENPHEKKGIVGLFCRAYSVEDAIGKFLPEVFLSTEYVGQEARYRYFNSSGGAGAVIYENGLFLYSHHGTDPYSDRLLNAWELVRLHKFGHLDDDADESLPTSKLPSHEAMVALARGDSEVEQVRKTEVVQSMGLERFERFAPVVGAETPSETESKFSMPAISDDEIAALIGEAPDDEIAALIGEAPDDEIAALIGEAPDAAVGTGSDWARLLDITEIGQVKSTPYNYRLILKHDPRFRGAFARNLLSGRKEITRTVHSGDGSEVMLALSEHGSRRDVEDLDHILIMTMLSSPPASNVRPGGFGYGLAGAHIGAVLNAMETVANENAYHPIKDLMESRKWDGVARMPHLLRDLVGAADDEFTREVSQLVVRALVSRVYAPGCKYDHMLILHGEQGTGKTSFSEWLGFNKYTHPQSRDIEDRKAVQESMAERIVMDMSELDAVSKSEIKSVKQFLSEQSVSFRPAYGRETQVFNRHYIVIGSTNEEAFLSDSTGNRRFLPVQATAWNEALARDEEYRLQVFAEALVWVRANMAALRTKQAGPLVLPRHLWSEAAARAEEHNVVMEDDLADEDASKIVDWLDRVLPTDALLGLDAKQFEAIDERGEFHRRVRAYSSDIWDAIKAPKTQAFTPASGRHVRKTMAKVTGWEYGRFNGHRLYRRLSDETPKNLSGNSKSVEDLI